MTAHAESRREPLPGALADRYAAAGAPDLAALTDAVVLLLERHETIAFNEWPDPGFSELQRLLAALGGKHRIDRYAGGKAAHAPGFDLLCAVCVETAGLERLDAEMALDEPEASL